MKEKHITAYEEERLLYEYDVISGNAPAWWEEEFDGIAFYEDRHLVGWEWKKDPQVGITVSIQVYPDAYSVCSRAVPERVEEDMFVHEFQLCPDIEKTIMVINEVMGCESKSYLLF